MMRIACQLTSATSGHRREAIVGRIRRLIADVLPGLVLFCMTLAWAAADADAQSLTLANARVQHKMVKIYGAGGVRGLEAYQSGFLISAEGHVLTAWSYVLDTDFITVVLHDGRRLQAEVVGADPRLEIAVLKIPVSDIAHFQLEQAVELQPGDRVLAFSNLYGIASGNESTSMLQGFVSAITPLAARRGVFETPYDGQVYVLDAMTNNAGAAGGALTDHQGQLVGILGKELRSSQSNIWLNYAIPVHEMKSAVSDILAGKIRRRSESQARRPVEPITLAKLGIVMLPPVLSKTPPYVEDIVVGSPADAAGIRADDLVVMIDGSLMQSVRDVEDELAFIDALDPVRLTVLRNQQLIEVELTARGE